MSFSYWELNTWFQNVDYTIVGSGIVGLHAALQLREKFPSSKILILEKGLLPEGASTKNAGFACFGSISEILEDIRNSTEQEVADLVQRRWHGLQILRNRLGDNAIDFKQYGGYELFLKKENTIYNDCLEKLPFINDILNPIFKSSVFEKKSNLFAFNNIKENIIFNPFEGQIDTGKMMQALLQLAYSKGILILNNQKVSNFYDNDIGVDVEVNDFSFKTKKLFFATNGFAAEITNNAVKPARAQVLITEPIKNLHIKGTFHLDQGYYYFRNINNRILFGGGRNMDFKTETTTSFEETPLIQNKLEEILKTVILPKQEVKIARRWSGIMGVGESKSPIVKALSTNVFCGVRLGGMGVAIGSLVGYELGNMT